MNDFTFELTSDDDIIIVNASIENKYELRLALDTAATHTTIDSNVLYFSGYYTQVRNGYMVMKPQWGLSEGIQKNKLKNKGILRFNVTDIFWTNLPRATITYANYIENWRAYRETRVANLSFTYRFGNNKVAAARRRATASEEERRRAGGM